MKQAFDIKLNTLEKQNILLKLNFLLNLLKMRQLIKIGGCRVTKCDLAFVCFAFVFKFLLHHRENEIWNHRQFMWEHLRIPKIYLLI